MTATLVKKLEKLAKSLEMNERELKYCISKIKQLTPDLQAQYLNVLDHIKNQLKPIHIGQLNQVKGVLKVDKLSGPALLSHVSLCLEQSQLIAKSLQQSKELIDQAYMASKHNPGTKSKMKLNARMNMESESELANQTSNQPPLNGRLTSNTLQSAPDDPRLNKTPRFGTNIYHNTPIRNSFAILRPQMVLLAKIDRIREEIRHQKNIGRELQADAYVDREILRVDKIVDEKILEIDKKADERILKLDQMVDAEILRLEQIADGQLLKNNQKTNKLLNEILEETTDMAKEVDEYLEAQITKQSQLVKDGFIDRQMSIKAQLSQLKQSSVPLVDERIMPISPKI